jgi:hypothetical protein
MIYTNQRQFEDSQSKLLKNLVSTQTNLMSIQMDHAQSLQNEQQFESISLRNRHEREKVFNYAYDGGN